MYNHEENTDNGVKQINCIIKQEIIALKFTDLVINSTVKTQTVNGLCNNDTQ